MAKEVQTASTNAATKAPALKIDTMILTGLLDTFSHMGNAAKIEHDAQRQAAGEKQIVWRDLCTLGARFVKEADGNYAHAAAVFNAHWLAAKGELTQPQNAIKYGSEPGSDGKFKVNKYLGECVSRVKGALERGLKVTSDKGAPMGLNEVANAVTEWNKVQKAASDKRKERELQKADPNRKSRMAIAGSLVEIGESVRKGSHDSATLHKVEGYLKSIGEILSANEAAMAKQEEADKAEATKAANAAATARGGAQHSRVAA